MEEEKKITPDVVEEKKEDIAEVKPAVEVEDLKKLYESQKAITDELRKELDELKAPKEEPKEEVKEEPKVENTITQDSPFAVNVVKDKKEVEKVDTSRVINGVVV